MSSINIVRNTPELARILALPRRDPESFARELIGPLSEVLRLPGSAATLRASQALALHDIGVYRGGLVPLIVGEGKTLVSFLAPLVLDSKRPILFLPANLIDKTDRDRARYSADWRVPTNIRLMSYEMLSRAQSENELEDYAPDLVMGDEVHRLKNLDAAVTRRFARYKQRHVEVPFVGLSGTVIKRSVMDVGHLALWALGTGSPLPTNRGELEEWSLALDELSERDEYKRYSFGALAAFAQGEPTLTTVRQGFRKHLAETPGIVMSVGGGEKVAASIYVRGLRYDVADITEEHVAKLREEKRTPDDWDVTPVDVWRHAKELALGFHGIWDPRPPPEWRAARRAWFAFCRHIVGMSDRLDSPEHIAIAIDAGRLPSGRDVLAKWRAIEPTFKPNEVPVWHDDTALLEAARWMRKPGVVWVSHIPFGERLARLTGAPYYANEGFDARGHFIEDADGKTSIIASVKANKEGRNLQETWSRCLIVSPFEDAGEWEQVIGRFHRTGQKADTVEVDVFIGCAEHIKAWHKARGLAKTIQQLTGDTNKILLADVDIPPAPLTDSAMWAGLYA